MSVTYRIKKESLYNNDSSEMTRVKEGSFNETSYLNKLILSIQEMICEINSKAKEKKQ